MTMKEVAKKIIASINPGIADISNIGDGTIKGAVSELNKNIGKKSTITWHTELLDLTANVERKYAFPNLPKHTTSFPILCEGSKGISGVVVAKDVLKDGGVIVISPVTQQVRILLIVID